MLSTFEMLNKRFIWVVFLASLSSTLDGLETVTDILLYSLYLFLGAL